LEIEFLICEILSALREKMERMEQEISMMEDQGLFQYDKAKKQ
jgi:hypothetical protein